MYFWKLRILKNRTQDIAIHPDHKKLKFSWKGRVSIELILLPKIMREQEVNIKKSEKKSFLQKMISLANEFQIGKLWAIFASEIFER